MLQVIVKGKVRAQRAKAMKFGDGYMVSSGHPAKIYLEKAFTHVQMRQGSIGIQGARAASSFSHLTVICYGHCHFM
jgi:ribosomal protein S3